MWSLTLRRQAAEAGDADAMAHLGHMYANGVGVAASNESALEWFDRAARRNHPSGQYGLGYLHLSGYGVPKDAKKAFKYFTSAAEQVHKLLLFIKVLRSRTNHHPFPSKGAMGNVHGTASEECGAFII